MHTKEGSLRGRPQCSQRGSLTGPDLCMWQTREDLGIASEGQQTCNYGSGSLTGALVTSLSEASSRVSPNHRTSNAELDLLTRLPCFHLDLLL
jgi:hypothetical protein